MLAGQFLTNNVGIAAMPEEALAQPAIESVECCLAHRFVEGRRAAGAKIAADRIARTAKLPRQPFGSPPQFMQPQHRGHLLCLKHFFSLHRS